MRVLAVGAHPDDLGDFVRRIARQIRRSMYFLVRQQQDKS
jgi:LmbE family N-acetylglucosaminyl deacetylase